MGRIAIELRVVRGIGVDRNPCDIVLRGAAQVAQCRGQSIDIVGLGTAKQWRQLVAAAFESAAGDFGRAHVDLADACRCGLSRYDPERLDGTTVAQPAADTAVRMHRDEGHAATLTALTADVVAHRGRRQLLFVDAIVEHEPGIGGEDLYRPQLQPGRQARPALQCLQAEWSGDLGFARTQLLDGNVQCYGRGRYGHDCECGSEQPRQRTCKHSDSSLFDPVAKY